VQSRTAYRQMKVSIMKAWKAMSQHAINQASVEQRFKAETMKRPSIGEVLLPMAHDSCTSAHAYGSALCVVCRAGQPAWFCGRLTMGYIIVHPKSMSAHRINELIVPCHLLRFRSACNIRLRKADFP
jgi:hypothetical protein